MLGFGGEGSDRNILLDSNLVNWSQNMDPSSQKKWVRISKPFRMALGALIIQEKLETSDRETIEQIRENPYLQYFIGMSDYSNEAPFEASMMVYFRGDRQTITIHQKKSLPHRKANKFRGRFK